jgi:hypothetical protein
VRQNLLVASRRRRLWARATLAMSRRHTPESGGKRGRDVRQGLVGDVENDVVSFCLFCASLCLKYSAGVLAGLCLCLCCLFRRHNHTSCLSSFSPSSSTQGPGSFPALASSPHLTCHSFYCILLLSALFVSSCHWSPVPLDTPLSRPFVQSWGNATTFREALALPIMKALTPEHTPSMIRFIDRCWCDMTATSGLFEPFDILNWELASVRRTALSAHEAMIASGNLTTVTLPPPPEPEPEAEVDTADDAKNATLRDTAMAHIARAGADLSSLVSLFAPFARRHAEPAPAPAPVPPLLSASQVSSAPSHRATPLPKLVPVTPSEPPPAPWELDLRPYGFNMLLDFAWSTPVSKSAAPRAPPEPDRRSPRAPRSPKKPLAKPAA